jgi:hypothetical protein
MLTNAWIADPENPITIRGCEIFSQPGTYKAVIEITTMDNDKRIYCHYLKRKSYASISLAAENKTRRERTCQLAILSSSWSMNLYRMMVLTEIS